MRKNVCTRIKGFILRRTDCVLSKSFFSNLEKFFFMSHIYPTTLINIPEYLPFPKIRINTHTHTHTSFRASIYNKIFSLQWVTWNNYTGLSMFSCKNSHKSLSSEMPSLFRLGFFMVRCHLVSTFHVPRHHRISCFYPNSLKQSLV